MESTAAAININLAELRLIDRSVRLMLRVVSVGIIIYGDVRTIVAPILEGK